MTMLAFHPKCVEKAKRNKMVLLRVELNGRHAKRGSASWAIPITVDQSSDVYAMMTTFLKSLKPNKGPHGPSQRHHH